MGDFDGYTVSELRDMVNPDRPNDMSKQAASWDACAKLLTAQHETLLTRLEQTRSSWSGNAASIFFTEMDKRCRELDDAARTASDNAAVWGRIRDHAEYARTQVNAIHDEWRNTGGTSEAPLDPQRMPFDLRARTVMSDVAGETDMDYRRLRPHEPFTPMSDGGPDGGGDTSGGTPPGGSGTSPAGSPGTSGIVEPTLQSAPPTVTPTPAPPPSLAAPTPTPAPLPPPLVGGPATVPPARTAPPRTTTPISGRLTPRPPQRTVPSVIGSRPGTTGMAPTSRGPTANQIIRPVIGARPGVNGTRATPTPKGPLIGRNGVVKGPGSDRRRAIRASRVPKTMYGDRSVNRGVIRGTAKPAAKAMSKLALKAEVDRLSRRDDAPTDDFWQPGTTVPGIITGGSERSGDHDPGPVVLRGTDTTPPNTEPHIVPKPWTTASNQDSDVDDGGFSWTMPEVGPSVVTGRTDS